MLGRFLIGPIVIACRRRRYHVYQSAQRKLFLNFAGICCTWIANDESGSHDDVYYRNLEMNNHCNGVVAHLSYIISLGSKSFVWFRTLHEGNRR